MRIQYIMITEIKDGIEMHFWRIAEIYPDSYILVKMTKIDTSVGITKGIPIHIGETYNEVVSIWANVDNATIITGNNKDSVLGGLL